MKLAFCFLPRLSVMIPCFRVAFLQCVFIALLGFSYPKAFATSLAQNKILSPSTIVLTFPNSALLNICN